ncbi:MAG: SIR2 family protein [Actinomycetota bacterium]|nr:SIR2 family protein [Actinomycetota bacterium]
MTQASEVYVLGAGFSKAVHHRMPLLADLSVAVSEQLTDEMPTLPRAIGGDLETALTYLGASQPWQGEVEALRNRALYLRITEVLRDELESRSRDALASGSPVWLRKLVRHWARTQAIVITLNYDCLIERTYKEAVRVTAGQPGDNYVHQGQLYVIPLPALVTLGSGMLGIDRTQAFRLVKLHGSLSWWYSGSSTFFGETIYDGGIAAKPDATHGKVPFVVPPTAGKNSFLANELVHQQWHYAFTSLGEAPRVTVIGYSLPETDELMRYLLALTSEGSSMTVVDPSPAVHQRYAALLPEAPMTNVECGAESWALESLRYEPDEPLELRVIGY